VNTPSPPATPGRQVEPDGQCKSGWYVTGWVRLAACSFGIVALWGWLLPAIGSRSGVRHSIEWTEKLGINPSAIFYTDVFQSPAVGTATLSTTTGDN
jgi:hypothetical protein